ncbi:MAG TPA: hypothetical protein VFZ91_08675 [Allosphingosinicella sp.]
MSDPPVIAFTPVPLRHRADGWTRELQLRFIVALSQGLKPGQAARSVGKNRQNAYALRKCLGAESFAAAWDAAVAYARRDARPAPPPRHAPPPSLPTGAEAEGIARRGLEAVNRLVADSPAAARRALDGMLDALYGPKSDSGDNSDSGKFGSMGSRT